MREDVYNPIKRFLLFEKFNKNNHLTSKCINQQQTKEQFFSLKKQSNKKMSTQRKQKSITKISGFQNEDNSFQSCEDNKIMAHSQDLCLLTRSIQDDAKTSSTKTVDSYQETASLAHNFSLMRKKSLIYSETNSNQSVWKCLNFKNQQKKESKSEIKENNEDKIRYFQSGKTLDTKKDQEQITLLESSFIKQKGTKIIQKKAQPVLQGNFFNQKQANIFDSNQKMIIQNNSMLEFNRLLAQKKKVLYVPKAKHFILMRKLGEGTYSKVYQACHKKTGLICALKILDKKRVIQTDMIENVIDQLKVLSFIQHPNIVKLWGFFQDNKKFYIVLEYCSDGQLYNLIKNYSKYDNSNFQHLRLKISYIYQLCSAINQLHTSKIMHRDIKPQNILISFKEQIKLCDFGWARIFNTPEQQLRRTYCGTPLYLAPQVIERNYYTKTIDTWALGILTFELLTGRIPFQINQFNDLRKIVRQQVCYNEIENFPEAINFIKLLLQKNGFKRQNIGDLLKHNFFNILKENHKQIQNKIEQQIQLVLRVNE